MTIRDLVRHALRHRPDRVVGEVLGAEAADLLQALNTGHGGSPTTVHANNSAAALSRLATCAMQASDALPWTVVCRGWSTASRPSFIRRGRRRGASGRPDGPRSRLRRPSEPLGRRAHLAAAVRRREKRPVDAEAGGGPAPTRKRRGAGHGEPSACGCPSDRGRRRRVVVCSGRWRTSVGRAIHVLRRASATSCWTLRRRRSGSGGEAPLDALRRRLACRRSGARAGSVLFGYAGTGTGRNATDGRLQGGEDE